METCELAQVCDHPLLTKEEEISLGRRSKAGDLDARRVLVENNLALVASIGKKLCNNEYTLGDCISLGTFGLMKAARNYDPDKYKTRFSTLASYSIRFEILRSRMPNTKAYNHSKIVGYFNQHDQEFDMEDETSPSAEEVVDKKDKIEKLNRALSRLSPQDQYFVKATYGLPPYGRSVTGRELAKIEGCSNQWVSFVVKRALERLRAVYGEIDG
jgi:RNA polymerase sigma factor (sigma-70 family)